MSNLLPQNPSVLIVEDERVFAMDLKQMLSDMGYFPFAIASSCDEAIAQASAKCPDIVLMDIRIDGPADGIATAEILKEKFDLPVIFLTAHADEATIQRAARATPHGYLLKPVKLAELQSSVAVALIRHQIEKRLREREQWFSKALRSFADSLVNTDGTVNTRFIDPVAGALIGERSGEALGHRINEVLKLLDDQSLEHSHEQLAALSSIFSRDITEWRRADERANLLASIVDSSDDAIFSWTLEGIVASWNRGAQLIYGYDPDEIIGQPISRLIHPDRPGELEGLLIRIRRGESIHHYETIRLRKDGSTISISLAASPMLDTAGRLTGVSAICRDITEWKRASQRANLLASIADNSDDAIFSWTLEGIITSWNRGAHVIYGYDPDEIIGQPISRLIHPERPSELDELTARIRRGEQIRHYETIRLRKGGSTVSISLAASPMLDARGGLIGISAICRDITDWKRTKSKLEFLASIVETSEDAIYSKSLEGIVTSWNAGAERFYGYRADEVIGRCVSLLVPAGREKEVPAALERIKRGETVTPYETQRLRKDGSVVDEFLTISPLRDAAGAIVGASSIARDITKEKEAEEKLRENKQRLDLAQEIGKIASWEWIFCSGTVIWTKEFETLYGLPSNESNKSFADWKRRVHPDDLARVETALSQAIATKGFYEAEFRIVWPDQSVHWIAARASTYCDERGEAVKMIGVNQDITDRKNAEQVLQSAARYTRSLIEASLDPLVTISREGKITDVNRATEQATGVARKQLIGSDFCDYFTEPEKAREGYEKAFAEGTVCDYPLTIRHSSGRISDVLYNAAVYRNPGGEIEGIFAAARDITERKRGEQELKRSNAELQQFAYVASHDLQEPLRMVASFTQLLSQRYHGKLDAAADEYITFAVDGAKRMQTLIDDLLAYSRVGTRGKPCSLSDCGEIVQNALNNVAATVAESGAQIKIVDLPKVNCDATQLEMLFQNLIANAVKFRDKNRPCVIQISARQEGQNWVFGVQDNGIGIERRHFERIFQVFQRLYTREEYPGNGIGLAICKKIIERHHGQIWLESQVGAGTTFFFTLPVAASQELKEEVADVAH